MNIFSDIAKFIKCWGFVDIIFFVAIIVLLILIVVLLYFIRINKDVLEDDIMDSFFKDNKEKEKKTDIVEEIVKNIAKSENMKPEVEEYNDEEGELIDLNTLTKRLEEQKAKEIDVKTEYEKDQEEKAIISYTELLEKCNNYAINYEKEEIIDDVIVKKVNLNDLENKNNEEITKSKVQVISYQKEEAFLKALKELNSLLN